MTEGKRPKKNLRGCLTIAAIVLFVASILAAGYIARAVPVGTAYFAKVMCSAVFVSGRPPEDVLAVDLALDNPLVYGLEADVDRELQQVTTSLRGFFGNIAVHRPGLGCTLAVQVPPEELRSERLAGSYPAPPKPWPDAEPEPAEPESAETETETAETDSTETATEEEPPAIDRQRLQRAVDRAFDEIDDGGRTRAVVVVHDGELVAERYADGFDADMPLTGWSMAKSVTNALVGVLVARGRLDVDARAPVPEWQKAGDPRRAITIDQLLRMSSGLEFDESYGDPDADVQLMLFRSPSASAFAASKPLRTEPDGEWYYSSGTSNILSRIVRQAVEDAGENYWMFPRRALFDKLGMTSATLEPDASGTFVGSSFCFATARDWARLGLLYLNDGAWEGERLLPPGWVEYSTTPTAGSNGRYGAHLWLNAEPGDPGSERRWPELPSDLFMMSGYEGQWVYVVPSKQAVVVRLGLDRVRSAWDGPRFLKEVLATLP